MHIICIDLYVHTVVFAYIILVCDSNKQIMLPLKSLPRSMALIPFMWNISTTLNVHFHITHNNYFQK